LIVGLAREVHDVLRLLACGKGRPELPPTQR
jgi:hypothetical protein